MWSILVRMKGGSAVTNDNMNVFCVTFGKEIHSAFKWKDAIFDFLFSQVVQKHWLGGEMGK